MIKVILPNKGSLANLDNRIISKIVNKIHGDVEYEIVLENRRIGRFIKVVNDSDQRVDYVCLSNPDNDSRNARLMQFISPAFIEYDKDNSTNKHFCVYIIDPDRNDKTDYAKMLYRCLMTIDVPILNQNELGIFGILPFTSYEDFKAYRNKTSERNSHNRQTYFVDESSDFAEQISVYGKTFGANAMESFLFAMTLSKISNKPIVFYQVVDNESTQISEDQKAFLTENGVKIGDVSIELETNGDVKTADIHETSRNTPIFHYNLLKKYGEKRCYICGCDIEHMVIGSHIERVTDIDHNTAYDNDEKNRRATDGDNGFWLCANHDKMFEYGIIYFDGDTLKVGVLSHDQTDKAYINHSFESLSEVYNNEPSSVGVVLDEEFTIRNEHYNQNMKDYLQKHKNRVTTSNIVL